MLGVLVLPAACTASPAVSQAQVAAVTIDPRPATVVTTDPTVSIAPSIEPAAMTFGATRSPASAAAPAAVAATGAERLGYQATIRAIDDDIAVRMTQSWREGCPVGLADLRLIELTHWDLAGGVSTGELVVHVDVAQDVARVFHLLFLVGYPIERMELVDVYAAEDRASMEANNTSAFNCRYVAGTTRWSEHAFGRAIDLNPQINPYVQGSYVSPGNGAIFSDRSGDHPALIRSEDEVVQAFRSIGWEWGGYWASASDYQHFSETGR